MEQVIRIRTIILLYVLLSGVTSTYAQSYHTLPDSNATWIFTDASSAGHGYFEHGLDEHQNDTVINAKAYIKMFYRGLTDQYPYVGAFRSNTDGKTYYVPHFPSDTVEYLLFDLSANMGDTVKDVALHIYPHDFVGAFDLTVDTVRQVITNSDTLKCLYLSVIDSFPPYYAYETVVWLESVGSLNGGIFNLYMCGLNVDWLRCMSVDDTIRYFNLWGDCHFMDSIGLIYEQGVCELPVSIAERREGSQLSAYPNPFTTSTTLEYELYTICNIQYTVYNMMGEMVFYSQENMLPPGRHTLTWSPGHLPAGLYYGVLRSGDGVSVVKMVKE